MNRAFVLVFDQVDESLSWNSTYSLDLSTLYQNVAFALGTSYTTGGFQQFFELPSLNQEFERCLQILEVVFRVFDDHFEQDPGAQEISSWIAQIVNASEVDLGIGWRPPIFVRTGAPVLDEHLVNKPLRWLSEPKYKSVRQPFEKGLSHYLEAQNRPDRLADVITDMYEAVEALAKIVTGRPGKDLSGNVERFISEINASKHYKALLRNYISYGNEFRHAEREGRPRPPLSEPEVESFIYLTGLFIRLAIRTT